MDVTSPTIESAIRLRDGRSLSYAEYGDSQGAPLMLFHGTPGSRLLNPSSILPAAAGKRIVVPDRPGYGRSDFYSGWSFLDWADDAAQLADALGIERFDVMGISGGGPYAAACAYSLTERVTSATLVCSPTPLLLDRAGDGQIPSDEYGSDEEIVAARTLDWPGFLAWFQAQYGPEVPDAIQWSTNIPPSLPPGDQKVRARPEVQLYLRQLWSGAFEQGMVGWAYDSWLLARVWGFDVRDIAAPTYLWHGEEDRNVPVENGRYLAATIPNCRATFYPGEGHIFFHDHWDEIFGAIGVLAMNKDR